MTAPQGHWRIVAAGFQGDLNLTADAQGNIHGTIEIDAPNVEKIHGFWDEAEQRLIRPRSRHRRVPSPGAPAPAASRRHGLISTSSSWLIPLNK